MAKMKKIIESVPNFSEGRDLKKIEKIVNPFRGKPDVKLLDYQRDEDHNRLVVTIIGEPLAVKAAMIEAIGIAIEQIDMRVHKGGHPRMGAVDVVPFIPLRSHVERGNEDLSVERGNEDLGVEHGNEDSGMAEAIELSKSVAKEVAETYQVPIFLYEKSATSPERENLANIRKGQFEKMAEKIKLPEWKPDFGTDEIHPSAGVTAIGARMPLIAFNVNLGTNQLHIADKIAKKVRHLSGGLRYCKAIGVELKDKGMVQVSMNMTDYTQTAIYTVFELIRAEAKRYGVSIIGSEIVGLAPMAALIDAAAYYLKLEDFSMNQILESAMME